MVKKLITHHINPTVQKNDRRFSQSINQSINQSISQSINPPIYQSINQSINLSIYPSISQSINQSINQSIEWSVDGGVSIQLLACSSGFRRDLQWRVEVSIAVKKQRIMKIIYKIA